MAMHAFHRTELLVGSDAWQRLTASSVAVIGLGGVGSFAAEAMARAGVGHLTLVDFDDVCLTNVNRQLHAFRGTVGKKKATLTGERCRQINPKADVRVFDLFYDDESSPMILDRRYDMVLDCIDNMRAKVYLLSTCVQTGQPVMSALGAGGRLDPTRVKVTDISRTKIDPFARIVRDNLRQQGIETGIECVWTDEPPNDLDAAVQAGFRCICPDKRNSPHSCDHRFQVQGSVSWMPSIFGMTLAGAALNRMLGLPVHSADHKPPQRSKPVQKPSKAHKKALMEAAGFTRESQNPEA